MQAPAGVTLTPALPPLQGEGWGGDGAVDGYHALATLNWTPSVRDLVDTEIVVRVQDSRGGVATRRFHVPVAGGNNAPVIDGLYDLTLGEGETLSLPIATADADGDRLTVTVRNLPPGAVFDAGTGLFTWVPGYDQAGQYDNVTIIAADGKATVTQRFNLRVEQGYAKPVLQPVAAQTLREGDRYALQLAGHMPGGLTQADGTTIALEYSAPWLPGGATLNPDTGWFEWTPGYDQHGIYRLPVTLTATYTPPGGEPVETSVSREIVFNVANANGAPIFEQGETWNVLEGQPLSISVFAFDPDNPGFEPKIRLMPGSPASGPETTTPSVGYEVAGLPSGASFDEETLEIVWTPGHAQAGSYSVTVTARDDGDGTDTPAVSQVTLPIVVTNANRAPDIGDIGNAFVAKGATLDIPISAVDADGNPVQLSFAGLPRFATYIQAAPAAGVLHFAPTDGDRGDYAITVIAQDDGDGEANQVLTQAKTFVLTVDSLTEAPVIILPRQVAAVVGQPISVPIRVADLDQDALTFAATGLPIGAVLTPAAQYGHATLTWTPEATDTGNHDIEISVTDSGLPPQDAGYVDPDHPIPNVTTQPLRIVVRAANAAPELLGVQANGNQVADSGGVAIPLKLNATEGVALTLDLYGGDGDADLIQWNAANLPRGMTLAVPGSGNHAVLHWTPDFFAAQDGNTGNAGLWRFEVAGSDGLGEFARSFEISVANVNQTPRILPMPLQLVSEADTLGFTVRSADADSDAVQLALIHDDGTPAGVSFDATSGYFEWTPDQTVVDHADSQPFTFSFRASDGTVSSTQTVQVRVFDVNRAPRLTVQNHAVVIGNTLSIPATLGTLGSNEGVGITAFDPDGTPQTDALAISFSNLPEGASYDAQARRLTWTPGPGQIGDFVATAQVSDGKNSTAQTFTVRVLADETANAPKIVVSATPSTPAQPGQTIVATVRADAWSGIASVSAAVRGEGIGSDTWQTVALDAAGRIKLVPTQPGLIDLRITAADRDGFTATQTQTLRVKDTADTAAPALAWTGVLAGASANGRPVELIAATALQAQLTERQLMGWKLELAPAGTDHWQTLASQSTAATAVAGLIAPTTLDPALWANGVYQLRLTAWDLVGRTREIDARIIIDTTQKAIAQQSATDATVTLAGHDFALTRTLDGSAGDFGNWRIPALDLHLTTDQPGVAANGLTLPWQEGARVWLAAPDGQALSFTLGTQAERLGAAADLVNAAPQVWRPVFANNQGWTLAAHGSDATDTPAALIRQGHDLYDQATGLPWVPAGFTLTAADGTRYELDTNGKLTGVRFADGASWIVSDAGIAAMVGNGADDTDERLDFIRDAQGRIERVASGDTSIIYRYDSQDRLILARRLDTSNTGTPYAYDAAGRLLTDAITANFGAAANWNAAGAWSGDLQAGATTTLAFAVRESELASTGKVPGGQGAVIVALETQGADSIEVTGASVVGTATINGHRTTLLRVTEAGTKLIRLTGAGAASVHVTLAGDMNRDGNIDGADSAAWETAAAAVEPVADINGDGQINAADRQVLYANYGLRANRAPVVAANLPTPQTHTDLATAQALDSIAEDMEGDSVFWRILGATHGTAKLSGDGQTLIFTPEHGYSGEAVITLQADDGFVATAPIALKVNVSGAKLLALRLDPLDSLRPGASAFIRATADFTDEQNVAIALGAWLTVTQADLAPLGKVGQSPLAIDDNRDLVRANASGPALVIVTRTDTDGRTLRAVSAVNAEAAPPPADPYAADEGYESPEAMVVQPDVYPGTLTLVPGGTRQLKVHLVDPASGAQSDISTANPTAASGTRYFVSDESIATVSDSGLITAHREGRVTISVVHLASSIDELGNVTEQAIGQSDIALNVQAAQLTDDDLATPAPQAITVMADVGGAVASATGETVLIGAGALAADTPVAIRRVELLSLEAQTGLPAPAPELLKTIAAFQLDLGSAGSSVPVQLAIALQDNADIQAGDEVLFLMRGTIADPNGDQRDVWWIVDNGSVGQDGIARTASPPYPGVTSSGAYIVVRKTTLNSQTGALAVDASMVDMNVLLAGSLAFTGNLAVGGTVGAVGATMSVIGTMAAMSVPFFARPISYDGAYQWQEIKKVPDSSGQIVIRLDNTSTQPPAAGQAAGVRVTAARFNDGTNQLEIDLAGLTNPIAETRLRIWLTPSALSIDGNGNARAATGEGAELWDGQAAKIDGIRTWKQYADIVIRPGHADDKTVPIDIPQGVALGLHAVVVQRMIGTDDPDHCGIPKWVTAGADPVTVAMQGRGDISVITTGRQINIVKQGAVIKEIAFSDSQIPDLPDFVGGYKTDQVAFSSDNRLLFLAGTKGHIAILDTATLRLLAYPQVLGSTDNISSLAVAGNYLYVAEGGRYSDKNAGHRLLRINIDETSDQFMQGQQIVLPGNVSGSSTPYGYFDLAVLKGRHDYLAVTASASPIPLTLGTQEQGQVFVLDIDALVSGGASLTAPAQAVKVLSFDKNRGKGPQYISPAEIVTDGNDDPLWARFLLSNTLDYDHGVAAVEIPLDPTGAFAGDAKVSSLTLDAEIPGQNSYQRLYNKYKMDIQRAQGAVYYKDAATDTEYALVADYYMIFNDPGFRDGALVGKQAGGKVGIVKNPFSDHPEYLGSTTPVINASIRDLNVSPDGSTLWGNINYWSDVGDTNPPSSGLLSWNLPELIKAAEAHSLAQQKTTRPIPFDREGNLGDNRQISVATPQKLDYGWVFGMANMETTTVLQAGEMRYGDIGMVDVIALIRDKLGKPNALVSGLNEGHVSVTGAGTKVTYQDGKENTRMVSGAKPTVCPLNAVVAATKASYGDGEFSQSGIMFVAPSLDVEKLRDGRWLLDGKIKVEVTDVKVDGKSYNFLFEIAVKDFTDAPGRVFFGDRPLDDPGYSKFEISEEVKDRGKNAKLTQAQALDVWRVEQRLKYLGFPAMGYQRNGLENSNVPQEFAVDGQWGAQEGLAGHLFNKVTHYVGSGVSAKIANVPHGPGSISPPSPPFSAGAYSTAMNAAANNYCVAKDDSQVATQDIDWLNAYNAPHWMQFFPSVSTNGDPTSYARSNGALPAWNNMQNGTGNADVELFGSSWMRDLMVAKQYAPAVWLQSLTNDSRFAGATDANHGYTPTGHASHDLGMAMDLGLANYTADIYGFNTNAPSAQVQAVTVTNPGQWSNASATAFIQALQNQALQSGTPVKDRQDLALADFLSLYAVTQKANGSRDALAAHIQGSTDTGKEKVLNALFGDGTPKGGLIDGVIIGGTSGDKNTYPDIRYALVQLGFIGSMKTDGTSTANVSPTNQVRNPTLANMGVHYSHFHIYLQPPAPVRIEPTQHLQVAEASGVAPATRTRSSNATAGVLTPELVRRIENKLNEETSVCAPPSGTSQPLNKDGIVFQEFIPATWILGTLERDYNIKLPTVVPTRLTQVPQHGKLVIIDSHYNSRGDIQALPDAVFTELYRYTPDLAYYKAHGVYQDKAKFEVDIGGYTFHLNYTIEVSPYPCGVGQAGDISQDGVLNAAADPVIRVTLESVTSQVREGAPADVELAQIDSLGQSLTTSPLTYLLTSLGLSSFVQLATADLAGAAVGQTTGTAITLDSDAAGHSWYIDYTPYLNEEYLPTSTPNEWIAKPGSEAAGKMDMLSVLLHEYGHALGIEHSIDPHDFMGTTLAPGVRRLPSSDELALMAKLVADAKGDLPTPANPAMPDQPGAPLPNRNGTVRVARARITREGTFIDAFDNPSTPAPQYEVAANPTLADPKLQTGTGWETTGSVSIGNGAAILREADKTQTRLNQVFLVGPHDRYLTFTVAGSFGPNSLDDQASAPDDAFEAALLDANSGASLLAGTGLTHNDAILNLQADGTQRAGQNVASILNADGSRTYRVDLAGIPAGTAVNLSFDLIGFGAATSHVTVRDIRLGVPETHDDSVAALEDTPIDIAATANDLDADQAGFVPVVVTGPTHGEVVVNPDGSFRYTPSANWYGDDSFSYKLSDGSVDSNVATVSLSVAAVNDAPVVADVGAATSEDTPVTLDLLASASDIDSATLTPTIVAEPQHGALALNADGSFTYTPEADWNGEDVFTYKVSDGELDSGIATVRVAVAAVNDAPVSRDFALATLEDTPLTFDLLAQSSDVDSALLTRAIVAGPQHGTLTQNADGTWTYASDANYNGADSFTYLVNDGALDSGIATVSLTVTPVNDAPVIAARTLELDEDTPLTLDLLAGAGDVDGDALSVVITQAPLHGVLAANPDGTWTYTPSADWNGTDSVEYQVSDGTATVPTSVTFIVKPVNDAPIVRPLALATLEDTALTFDLLVAASDIDSALLMPAIVAGPQHGTLTQNADGSYTYTPESNYNGADSFAYRVNDGELDSNIATVSLAVTPVNDVPVIGPRTLELDEDTPLTLDLLAGASDIDGDALSVAITQAPLHGSLVANPDGTWTYAPDTNWNGTDRVECQVSDGTASVPTSVTFVVIPINDTPVADPLALATLEDTALTFDLLTAASDIDSTVLTPAIVTGPQHGTLTLNADGSFTYTPDANYHGADGFAYQVNDGELDSNIATVSLTVTPVNDVPVIAARTLELDEDTPLTLDLLAGASDIDGDALSVTITQARLHGSLVANLDGTWTYAPDTNWNGTDRVEYQVSDGTAGVPTSVTFVVKPINDAPVVGPMALATLEDAVLTFDLLTAASDIDSTVLTPAIVTGPQHGTLTQNADGRYTYTPDANTHGTDSLSYRVNDGDLDSTIATVSLTVTPVNDAPSASPIAATLLEDGRITLDLLAAASDIDGDPLTISPTDPQSGTLTHNPDGTWTYKPSANFNGQDGFSYTVSDGRLAAESFVRLTITAVNDVPVADDDSAALIEDGSITLALLANDRDIDADPLSVLIQSQPTHGAIVLNPDNTVTYTPAENWSGEDRFTYRLSDGQALSEIATVRLAVNPVADAPALVLTDRGGNSRELFRTGWESVGNRNAISTLVEKRELEGWTRVTRPDPSRGGDNGFEVWSSGDKMTDAKGKQRTVAAAAGDGKNWLELNDARGEGHQTLGIERTVDTVAGASYLLTLDYAGRIGYGADTTRIGIYVDSQRIAGYANTSPAAALDWKALQFQFIGTGGQQTIKIVTEASQLDRNGRGAMIDDIAVVETLPANTGFEDGSVRLSAVSAALTDSDGSETLKVEIQALPVGATLSDGTRSFTATQGSTAADVTGWSFGNLSLVPPKDFNGSVQLHVVATATESATGNQASSTANLTVTVLAVNDAPQANDARFTVEKGGSIRIDFATLVGDVDGKVLALALAKPDHGTLSQNADGTYTYTPRRGYTGIDGFSYTASDGSLSATGRIAIDVVRDDHDHHDHHHDDRHRGDDDHGACIVVRSIDPNAAPVRIDWNGTADNEFMSLPVNQADWLPELLGIPQADKRSLAEITGLVVRVKE